MPWETAAGTARLQLGGTCFPGHASLTQPQHWAMHQCSRAARCSEGLRQPQHCSIIMAARQHMLGLARAEGQRVQVAMSCPHTLDSQTQLCCACVHAAAARTHCYPAGAGADNNLSPHLLPKAITRGTHNHMPWAYHQLSFWGKISLIHVTVMCYMRTSCTRACGPNRLRSAPVWDSRASMLGCWTEDPGE